MSTTPDSEAQPVPPDGAHADPRAELELLTRAVQRHAARRARAGIRRIDAPRPSDSAPLPEAQAPPVVDAGRTAPGSAEPAPTPIPRPGNEPSTAPRTAPARTTPAAPVAPAVPAPLSASASSTPTTPAELRTRAAGASDLDELRAGVAECRACGLCETRTQTVFQDGQGTAGVLFVGEAPGFHEDQQGVPFVGQAGALLTDIIEKGMGLRRSEVAIANVLKCRPPENRDPTADEKALCTAWLDRQIELLNPRVIVPLGRHASGHLLQSEGSMGSLRARVHERGGRKIVPTYHPAYLLRSPGAKRDCWQDIQRAMAELGLDPPNRDTARR